jgi:hypothetical protein
MEGYDVLNAYMIQHDGYGSDESYAGKNDCLTPPYISPQKVSSKRKPLYIPRAATTKKQK